MIISGQWITPPRKVSKLVDTTATPDREDNTMIGPQSSGIGSDCSGKGSHSDAHATGLI